MTAPVPRGPVLVGGVGYRWAGDASFGLEASDRLARRSWPAGVTVEDLGYGALYVAQDLADADPPLARLILLAGVERGRPAGTLERIVWHPRPLDPQELQARIFEAGAGVVDVDHLLAIAQHFEALPPEVVLYELEPVCLDGGVELSPRALERLEELERTVVREVLEPGPVAPPGRPRGEPAAIEEGRKPWNALSLT